MSEHEEALLALGRAMSKLETERQDWMQIAIKNQQIVEMIPMGYPDGTGFISAASWVAWAKNKLGYNIEGEANP